MKKFSQQMLSEIIRDLRKKKNLTQIQLSEATGINRAMIGRIEKSDYIPTINQMESLAQVLDFEPAELFIEAAAQRNKEALPPRKIAVAGTGYVGLSLAVCLLYTSPSPRD